MFPIRRYKSIYYQLYGFILTNFILIFSGAVAISHFWYPHPFDIITEARKIIILTACAGSVVAILLALVTFDAKKPKNKLQRDIAAITLLQVVFLAFGSWTLFQSRPVWIAFEGDRFRVVKALDIEKEEIPLAPNDLQRLSLYGPIPLYVRLATFEDSDFRQSVELALRGLHPAFRPERWRPYSLYKSDVAQKGNPVEILLDKSADNRRKVNVVLRTAKIALHNIRYYPLVSDKTTSWSVLLNIQDGSIVGYVEVDGWDVPIEK